MSSAYIAHSIQRACEGRCLSRRADRLHPARGGCCFSTVKLPLIFRCSRSTPNSSGSASKSLSARKSADWLERPRAAEACARAAPMAGKRKPSVHTAQPDTAERPGPRLMRLRLIITIRFLAFRVSMPTLRAPRLGVGAKPSECRQANLPTLVPPSPRGTADPAGASDFGTTHGRPCGLDVGPHGTGNNPPSARTRFPACAVGDRLLAGLGLRGMG